MEDLSSFAIFGRGLRAYESTYRRNEYFSSRAIDACESSGQDLLLRGG